jgi:predicted RNase H-like HicB family nuclease
MHADETATDQTGDSYLNAANVDIMMPKKTHSFTVIIEKGEDGFYVGSVPSLKGRHTQGRTVEELLKNIKEAIALCLEDEKHIPEENFVGVRKVQVRA